MLKERDYQPYFNTTLPDSGQIRTQDIVML